MITLYTRWLPPSTASNSSQAGQTLDWVGRSEPPAPRDPILHYMISTVCLASPLRKVVGKGTALAFLATFSSFRNARNGLCPNK